MYIIMTERRNKFNYSRLTQTFPFVIFPKLNRILKFTARRT